MNHIEVKVEFEKCEWSRESDDVWRSDCGLLWEFDNEETPKANNMNYCPQCGKILMLFLSVSIANLFKGNKIVIGIFSRCSFC